ncbi:MAG: 3-dehydroquinate synthase [Alphaproteobacteria bacterium]|nr:3-dehydroquinate synthase [Alphaproteobacteria bacterium]
MQTQRIEIKRVVDESYDIGIGWGLVPQLIDDIKARKFGAASRYVLITDSNVSDFYAKPIQAKLVEAGIKADLLVFPAGEKSKTRETKALLEDQMIALGCKRDTCIVAVGGGVVSDLAGFVAGTYARGIPFLVYSTTLLSAADASVGGKTAIDTPQATNLIGLFCQPKKVYIDIDTWKTLDPREFRSGMAETIKHACIASRDFFDFLKESRALLSKNQFERSSAILLERVAQENVKIKSQVVAVDPEEKNYRQVLNLGHTIGRALETLCQYELTHGECVAIGLVLQAEIGQHFGYLAKDDVADIKSLFFDFGLPISLPPQIDTQTLVTKMFTDKKGKDGQIRMVFQKGIGDMMSFERGEYSRPVREDLLVDLINKAREAAYAP